MRVCACVRVTNNKSDMDKKQLNHLTNYAEESEKAIERYLVRKANENGLPCLKYSNPNMVGFPDRLLVLPGGMVIWVELKSKGQKPTKIQTMRIAELTKIGHMVRVIDNKTDIDNLFAYVSGTEFVTNFVDL